MQFQKELCFFDVASGPDTLVITGSGNAISTNVIYTNANESLGDDPLVVDFQVGTAVTGSTSLQFIIQDSSDNSTWTDLIMSAAIANTALVAGYRFSMHVPPKHKAYLRVKVLNTTATATTVGTYYAAIPVVSQAVL